VVRQAAGVFLLQLHMRTKRCVRVWWLSIVMEGSCDEKHSKCWSFGVCRLGRVIINMTMACRKQIVDCTQTVLQHISNGELKDIMPAVASSW
jgi:hypothetical protein